MADILDRDDAHLLLEPYNNTSNSFIANVNILVKNFTILQKIAQLFDEERVRRLLTLVNVDINQLVDDMDKGSYDGYRKLDIDLLTNYKNYSKTLSDTEKKELWANTSAVVYYGAITVEFKDRTIITKQFKTDNVATVIKDHHQLYSQLDSWAEFKAKYGYTLFDISEDTPLYDHELLRIRDGEGTGSKIKSITLHVAPQGNNLNYDAVYQGAKNNDPVFTWTDTSSVLITVANDLKEILNLSGHMTMLEILHQMLPDLTAIHASLYELVTAEDSIYRKRGELKTIVENIGDLVRVANVFEQLVDLETRVSSMTADITALLDNATTSAENAKQYAINADTSAKSILNLGVHITSLASTEAATASYSSNTGILELGVPRGRDGFVPNHEWTGTALRFENPDGTWGNYVNLKGDVGTLSPELMERLSSIESRLSMLEEQPIAPIQYTEE